MTIVALSGGIGGAKLALGLYHSLPEGELRVVVNTGDDFDHFGLRICPDIDTVLYTLANLDDKQRGWGRAQETWNAMRVFGELDWPTWFSLGDADLALHIARTQRLREGATLTAVVNELRIRFGITASILPMTDAQVATHVDTDIGSLEFQEYFVKHRCEPRLRAVHVEGAACARVTPQVLQAFADEALEGIIVCPSNPYLSIDPMLALPELRHALEARRVPVIAISPLVGGNAVKGPTAKIMRELGVPLTTASIAAHYTGLIDALVIDRSDADLISHEIPIFSASTLMRSLQDRTSLAAFVLARLREISVSKH